MGTAQLTLPSGITLNLTSTYNTTTGAVTYTITSIQQGILNSQTGQVVTVVTTSKQPPRGHRN